MTANTWVARLAMLGKDEREIVCEYLAGMDQAGPVPSVKWLKERVMESDLRAKRRAAKEASAHE